MIEGLTSKYVSAGDCHTGVISTDGTGKFDF
jgi:hypothetical protein